MIVLCGSHPFLSRFCGVNWHHILSAGFAVQRAPVLEGKKEKVERGRAVPGPEKKAFPYSWHLCPSLSLTLELETLLLASCVDTGQFT